MVVFPNAKINLGLNIINKYPNGYHSIESCFYPIPLTDALEVIESNTLTFTCSGLKIPNSKKNNLCLMAYQLVKKKLDIPPISIHLHKKIPVGAGLGGGSADGVFMIKLLNKKFNLGLSIKKMEKLASKLGSDCPFFIHNKPLFVTGTGNMFSNIKLSLEGQYLVLVMPNIHISTALAYAKVTPTIPSKNLKSILETTNIKSFQGAIKNDFEPPIFIEHPALAKIKANMIKQGAFYASMSGSGSSIFGIFSSKPKFSIDYPYYVIKL